MAAVRRGSRVLGRTYNQVKLEIGYESAPGAFVSEAPNLSRLGASTATQEALMLSAVALTNLPVEFRSKAGNRIRICSRSVRQRSPQLVPARRFYCHTGGADAVCCGLDELAC